MGGQAPPEAQSIAIQADAPCLGDHLPTGPLEGDQTLAFEMLELPADLGLSMLTYSAEPGTRSEEAMRELARWSETRTKLSAARARSGA